VTSARKSGQVQDAYQVKTLSAFVKQSTEPTIDFLLAPLIECQTEAAPRHCQAHPRRLTDPRRPFDPRNPHRYMFGLPDGYVLLPYRGVKFDFCSGT
jgi:hypothetical protein